MASTNETTSTAVGLLKPVFGKDLIKQVPDSCVLQKLYPKLGDSNEFPKIGQYFQDFVSLKLPWGFTCLGTSDSNLVQADAQAGLTAAAQVTPSWTVLADNYSSLLIDRSAEGGVSSVMTALKLKGITMTQSARNYAELQCLHGQAGLGTASANISGSTVTFDPATTSAGILNSLVNARVIFMTSNLTTARTANDSSNYLTVTGVDTTTDPNNPTVTLTATGTTNILGIVSTDVMFVAAGRGVSVASGATSVSQLEMIGLLPQLAATTGTVFNIDKAAQPSWKANIIPSVGRFSPSVLMDMAAAIGGRGVVGGVIGKYRCLISYRAYGVLNQALAVNEVFLNGGSMRKKSGAEEIEINSAGGMVIEVVAHPFMKDGSAVMFPVDGFVRLGSVELSFAVPGRPQDEFMYPVNNNLAWQFQARFDWQGYIRQPAASCIATGITY